MLILPFILGNVFNIVLAAFGTASIVFSIGDLRRNHTKEVLRRKKKMEEQKSSAKELSANVYVCRSQAHLEPIQIDSRHHFCSSGVFQEVQKMAKKQYKGKTFDRRNHSWCNNHIRPCVLPSPCGFFGRFYNRLSSPITSSWTIQFSSIQGRVGVLFSTCLCCMFSCACWTRTILC